MSIADKIRVLRNQSVQSVSTAFRWLKENEAMSLQSWVLCAGDDNLNLSQESLTATSTIEMLRNLPDTDPAMAAELHCEQHVDESDGELEDYAAEWEWEDDCSFPTDLITKVHIRRYQSAARAFRSDRQWPTSLCRIRRVD